ncbi:MAG TPA: CBS domain-containing protein [Verrucomicrobiae bacterium]|nr:CBS domain-containing protein [Verrucomicrobiae bacterium]
MAIKCGEIMDANPPVLRPEDTVLCAVELLLERRQLTVPVVDASRRYIGMFAKSGLFGLMLPKVVAIEEDLPSAARISDLAFLAEDFRVLRDRFAELGNRRVGELIDASVPTVTPDTLVAEAVLLLFRAVNFLPVVEPGTGRLAGVLSTWDVLARLRGTV